MAGPGGTEVAAQSGQAASQPGGTEVAAPPAEDAVAALRAALRDAEQRLVALAEPAPVGILLSEDGTRLGYVNQRFAELTGVDRQQLLGTGWLDGVHPDDRERVLGTLQTVLSGASAELSVRLGLTEGHRWVHLRLAPARTPSGTAGFVGTAEDVTARRAWEERLTFQAHHDPLTGLANRRRLLEVLQGHLDNRRRRDREIADLFVNLDGFKGINDAFGHDGGDRVLVEVARRLQRTARDVDLLGRVAGDEFVVVLRSVLSAREAEAAARRHLAALALPYQVGRAEVALSASIGIALPAAHDTPETLLQAADRMMADAKAAGPGTYRLAPCGPA